MIYDSYGRKQWEAGFGEPKESYMVDDPGTGRTYICYDGTPERVIRRITTAGSVTTIEYGFGAWENRESLKYQNINEILEV